jgi:uncharacterized protein (DUF1697 family)
MPRYVALFRGINVGKAKRIAMADLRVLLEGLGYTGVRTLLNSGNVVFDGPGEVPSKHAQAIRTAVSRKLGIDALVIIKSSKDMAAVIAGNKLGTMASDPARLLVALTEDANGLAVLDSLPKTKWGSGKIQIGKHAAYVWLPDGVLGSKLGTMLLKELADSGTTRNWSTILKINSLLQSDA